MNIPAQRPLRADAARNAELLVRTAQQAFAESGADVPLEEIARRAGVGVATLYRRFPTKDDLIRAVLEWRYAEQVEPAVGRSHGDGDPWRGMVDMLEAGLTLAAAEHRIIKAARDPASLIESLESRFLIDLTAVVRRAQDAGLVRADLRPDDLPMLMFMLISTLRLANGPTDGWRRYLALLLDGLRPAAASPLPPAPGDI